VGPAVFWELRHLAPGDRLTVTGADGVARRFRVSAVEAYPADAVPLERVFGAADEPRLNLVTCGGRYDPAAQDYEERLVVYSEAVD
jgi:sortase (surface protein transpeptidase)